MASDNNNNEKKSLWSVWFGDPWHAISGIAAVLTLLVGGTFATTPAGQQVISQIPVVGSILVRVEQQPLAATAEAQPSPIATVVITVAAPTATATPTRTPASTPSAPTAVAVIETRTASNVEEAVVRRSQSTSFFGGDLRIGLQSVETGNSRMGIIISPISGKTSTPLMSVGSVCIAGGGNLWFRVEAVGVKAAATASDEPQATVRVVRSEGAQPAAQLCP